MPLLIALLLSTSLATPVSATDTPILGGPGGDYFKITCLAGSYLVGLAGRTGGWVDQIRPICAAWLRDQRRFGPSSIGIPHGTSSGGNATEAKCPRGYAINYWFLTPTGGSQPKFISSITFRCTTVEPPQEQAFALFSSQVMEANPKYAYAIRLQNSCPPGELAVGFHGRAGPFLDAVGLVCGPAPPTGDYGRPLQLGKVPTPLSTGPTIVAPVANGLVIHNVSKFQVVPAQHFSGSQILVQFTRLEGAPGQLRETFAWQKPTSDLGQGANIPDEIFTKTREGRWSMRARVEAPMPGDFSAEVPFRFTMQNPAFTTKPRASSQLQGR